MTLHLLAAGKAAEPGCGHQAMAGDEQQKRVVMTGLAHGPGGAGPAELGGQIAVGLHRAPVDGAEQGPDPELEVRGLLEKKRIDRPGHGLPATDPAFFQQTTEIFLLLAPGAPAASREQTCSPLVVQGIGGKMKQTAAMIEEKIPGDGSQPALPGCHRAHPRGRR